MTPLTAHTHTRTHAHTHTRTHAHTHTCTHAHTHTRTHTRVGLYLCERLSAEVVCRVSPPGSRVCVFFLGLVLCFWSCTHAYVRSCVFLRLCGVCAVFLDTHVCWCFCVFAFHIFCFGEQFDGRYVVKQVSAGGTKRVVPTERARP
jgi:hypothetical protein